MSNSSTSNYAASHSSLLLSSKRFEQSPFADRYIDDSMLFGLYSNRFYPLSDGKDVVENYWHLRKAAALYDVPEKPLDIKGPDAVKFLERIFTRKIDDLKIWRARYAIACAPNGGIIMDGVLIRLAQDHFWYVHADGDFEQWLLAFQDEYDVVVSDPGSRVLQIQGPLSLDLLRNIASGVPDNFGYFHAGFFDFDGQQLLVTRTGWTGELGFEIYPTADSDHLRLWDYLISQGGQVNLKIASLDSMGIRRLEAGILDYGTDMDRTMTPFQAGLGGFVDFGKTDFIGKKVLSKVDQKTLLMGLITDESIPFAGLSVVKGYQVVGSLTAGAWSPGLNKGIGYVRFLAASECQSDQLELINRDGSRSPCSIVKLPFFDPLKEIPRGISKASFDT
ncbi:MAG: glycine cleavage system aminomethyltransferase T [Gammaproteobacteria bacterium]